MRQTALASDGAYVVEAVSRAAGALALLDDAFLLNTWSIGGADLGRKVCKRLQLREPRLELSAQQCRAMAALAWEPLRGKASVQSLVLASVLQPLAVHGFPRSAQNGL